MKNLKKIILYATCIGLISTSLIARQKKQNATQDLLDAVNNHQAGKIAYKNIINPTTVDLKNPSELNNPPARLSHEEKVEKYKTDAELREIFHRHAYGLIDGPLLTSRQALNFFNMSVQEQQSQMRKWLKDHNVHQNNQLKEVTESYHAKIKQFKGSTQYDVLKNVAKIQRSIQDRDDQIKNLKKQLNKHNLSDTNQQQKQQEIKRLESQNNVDDNSIQEQLSSILNKLQELDQEFKDSCDTVLQNYQEKNHEMLGAVNKIVSSKKQSFTLTTPEKYVSKIADQPSRPQSNSRIDASSSNSNSVILSEPISSLIKNTILNTMIERHEKELQTMQKNNPDYKIIKEELKRLKLAQHLRDIQGTSIN